MNQTRFISAACSGCRHFLDESCKASEEPCAGRDAFIEVELSRPIVRTWTLRKAAHRQIEIAKRSDRYKFRRVERFIKSVFSSILATFGNN